MTKLEDILLPPNDYELEKMALAMIVMEFSNIDLFDKDCFYWEWTRKVFESMKKTWTTDFSPVAIDSWISIETVIDYTSNLISESSYWYIVDQINKYKNARLILRWVNKLENQARWLEIDRAVETINKLWEFMNTTNQDKTIKELWLEYYEDIYTEKKQIKFWYKLLDWLVELYWWQLITIAGRPSMWKTTVMQNIAIRQSKDWKVWFVSIEMQIFELIDRFVCITWWLTSYDIKQKKQNADKIQEHLLSIMENNLFLTENTYTLAKIEQFIMKNELDVCHIDYLWLIQYWDNKTSIIARISEITRQLKAMAKRRNCAIILWCQLSREVEKRNDKRPILADLRDSWTIEQDSDVVIMLYRDEYYDDESEDKNKLELIVRKQRNGATWTVKTDTKFSSYRIIDNWVIWKPF